MRYDDALTVREARDKFFALSGFTEEQYTARFARFSIGKFNFWVPNSRGRARALPYHDAHHVLTEYDTTWTGEAEIAAWELAAGCYRLATAFIINIGAIPMGMLVAPARTYRAFIRGRHSLSLYGQPLDDLLPSTVRTLRERLQLNQPLHRPSQADRLMFVLTVLLGFAWVSLPFVAVLAFIRYK